MNRKIALLICLVPLVALILTSCSGNNDLSKSETNKTADISITLSTQNESTYKITLDKDRNLNTYVYENQSKDYSSNESVQLSQEQYDSLMEQVNSLGEFKENTNSAAYDYWVVNLNVNSEEHNFTYGLAANENYDKLVQSIVELSPIKAVDSQGNGIVPFQAENN